MRSYDLSARGDETLYAFLYQSVRDDVISGAIAAGERLPSKRALAEREGVSVVTVEAAYRQLVAEGYVVARPRRGYFAARIPRPQTAGTARRARPPEGEDAAPGARKEAGQAQGAEEDVPLLYDFSRPGGAADPAAARLWGQALRHTLTAEPEAEAFAPTPGQGLPRLHEAIAAHLARARGMEVDPACVVVGAGAQLLYCLVAQLVRGRGAVAVEDPGYPRLAAIYRANGLPVAGVPLDGEGVRVDVLRSSGAGVVHVMPSHQFPTGHVTSIARRYELLGWAASGGGLVVEDDYDSELRLAGRPIPALASMDETGAVVYLNTFSKSLGAALRMAYLVVPEGLVGGWRERLGCYSCTVSAVDQVALAWLLETGAYERHVRRFRTERRAVRDALLAGLAASPVAGRLAVESEDAGLHFVLAVEGAGEGELVEAGRSRGLGLAGVSAYRMGTEAGGAASARGRGGGPEDAGQTARLVMQYDALPLEDVPEVVARLADAVTACG